MASIWVCRLSVRVRWSSLVPPVCRPNGIANQTSDDHTHNHRSHDIRVNERTDGIDTADVSLPKPQPVHLLIHLLTSSHTVVGVAWQMCV